MKKLLFYLTYLLSPVWLVYTIYMANPAKYDKSDILFAMLLGVMAYTWLIWQFVLSAKAKFIETYIGKHKVYRVHGMTALVAILLLIGHKVILDMYFGDNLMTSMGLMALIIYSGVSILSILMATKNKWLKWRPINKVRAVVNLYKYKHHRRLHNLTFIALLLMQVHVLMTSSARNSAQVIYVYMVYFVIALNFYGYHKLYKPWLQKDLSEPYPMNQSEE